MILLIKNIQKNLVIIKSVGGISRFMLFAFITRRKHLVKQLSLEEEEFKILLTTSLSKRQSLSSPTGKRLLLRRRSSIQSLEQTHIAQMLTPTVEGRIFHLDKMVSVHWAIVF